MGSTAAKLIIFIIVAVAAQMAVRALCRTGLAADAVARHVGVGAGVVVPCPVDVVFHHGQQLPADFFGDDLAADVRADLLDDVAVLVGYLIHHMRGDEVAAVDGCEMAVQTCSGVTAIA